MQYDQASSGLSGPRLTRFADPHPSGKQYFTVTWEAPSSGLAPGTVLLFEYTQTNLPKVQSLHVSYPFTVNNRRKAVFEINRDAFREGGPVKTWRVRLIYKGRLLAWESTADWE